MLTVTIPQSDSSSLVTKNVPLRNDTAKVKDICTVLGHMCSISNPSEFTLFSIVDGKGKNPRFVLILAARFPETKWRFTRDSKQTIKWRFFRAIQKQNSCLYNA